MILGSELFPVISFWLHVPTEHEAELSQLVTTLQSKYKMHLIK